jgi:signal-transduction protein with cAMP-binding, CBS, and nucleotidyltransferase domain
LNEEPVNRLMTEPVLSVEITDEPSGVFRLLTQYKVHHLPVVRGGCLVGMCERLSYQVKQLERIRIAAERYLSGGQEARLHAELKLALEAAELPR